MSKNSVLKSVSLNGYITRVRRSAFLKSVSTLAAGTVLSQLIIFGASPFLTRIYSPADFGVLALFTSISMLAAILTTGRYELAIGLPEAEKEALNVFALTVLTAFMISACYLLIIMLLRQIAWKAIPADSLLYQPAMYLVPAYTFLAANYSCLVYWNQRKKSYMEVSGSTVIQAVFSTLINIVLGLIGLKAWGLIAGLLMGQLGGNVFLLIKMRQTASFEGISLTRIGSVARKFIDFPKYMTFSGLLLTTSQQVVPIIFSFLFNAAIVGFFSLANRMLRVPNIVLTTSIGNVFRNDAIDSIRSGGHFGNLYMATLRKLTLLSVPIYAVLWIVSPLLFVIFFGKDWEASGYFARIICIMLALDFIASPLSTLFYVIGKQKAYLWLQCLNTVTGIGALWAGEAFFKDAYMSISLFTLTNCVFSLLTIYMTYRYSKAQYRL
ncbi:oligosaccharide flippase family protein [Chitinophaga rhizophila]|uniref:Oligosaccharide flippase family protein n=1 Tax=Chitinophaga rhizophila TaxID=2866212 RepID=A0ABS7GI23_9BACT|nr:oligosaccharide flippase family protein [Chitinophaga rhizophila]MBW8687356.1 oligosaccharide flippase family protein [Chitinophaga rhizophila]